MEKDMREKGYRRTKLYVDKDIEGKSYTWTRI